MSALQDTVRALRRDKVRVSIFIDPDLEAVRWASALDADRIELYTEPYAKSFAAGGREREESFARTPRRQRSRTASGLVSTPATISISTT